MTVVALPVRPLEDNVHFGCHSCQGIVRSIRGIESDLRKQVRLITKDPDSSYVPSYKEKIVELKEKKAVQRERLDTHIEHDH